MDKKEWRKKYRELSDLKWKLFDEMHAKNKAHSSGQISEQEIKKIRKEFREKSFKILKQISELKEISW